MSVDDIALGCELTVGLRTGLLARVKAVLIMVGLSTVAGERLQSVARRVPVPGFRRLLPAPEVK